MKELKRHKLRTDYGNETGDKIRTEHYVTYNHDYVKWLEDRLLKLLIIGDVSGSYSVNDMEDAYDKGFKDAMVKYRE